MAGVESKLLLANIGFVLYMIYVNFLLVLTHACLQTLKSSNKYIKKIHEKLASYLYWAGLNRFFIETFLDLALLSILNLHTADWNSQFVSVKASNIVSVITLTSLSFIMLFYIVGYWSIPRETRTQEYGHRFSPLLEGTKYDDPKKAK